MKALRNITRHMLSLVLTAIGLVSGFVSPGHCRAQEASGQSTTVQTALGSWSFTGKLNAARYAHTASLLPDGKLLIAGGRNKSNNMDASEIYDPESSSWTVTGDLNVARSNHTATVLPGGKVLIVGGFTAAATLNGATSRVEIYNPDSGTFSNAASLDAERYCHTATMLQDGRILITGGYGAGILSSAELYDPLTGTWRSAANLTMPRYLHTATLLQNGKVLVVGGVAGELFDSSLSEAELYDPATNTWSLTGFLKEPRALHTALLLPDGRVLVANGEQGDDAFDRVLITNSSELYDPASGTWTSSGPLDTPRISHTATLLSTGGVLVTGGSESRYFSSSEMYDEVTGAWRQAANLNTARFSHTATQLTDGTVLVVGGEIDGVTLDSAELYDPAAPGPIPKILNASVQGKRLIVLGENFDLSAVILINGEEQKTLNDVRNTQPVLIGKKAGKRIKAGDKLQVRRADGTLSQEFTFPGS